MKRNLTLLIFLIIISLSSKSQTPVFEWEAQRTFSSGKLIAHTSVGNIVVCGTYGNDYPGDWVKIITIMYDTNGTELWSSIYEDTINGGINDPWDLVIDTFDNIYIAGHSHLSFDGLPITPEVLILKYNKNGDLIWKQELGDSINFQGGSFKMQLFQNRYIYVSGYGQLISGSQNKSIIAKYDSSGQILWSSIDANNFETTGIDLEVDKSENIYLIGTTACCVPGYKMYIKKFNSSGNILWDRTIYDSLHVYATAICSAIDDSSNVYVSGLTKDTTFSTGYDCVVAKVDSAGHQKWFTVYNSTLDTDYWENPKNIIVDTFNSVYVSGTVGTGNGGYGFIFKVLNSGIIMWDHFFNSPPTNANGFTSLTLDSSHNLIATGGGNFGGIDRGVTLISFDLSGQENWRVEKQGSYSGTATICFSNSIYVTGANANSDPQPIDDSLFLFKFHDSLIDFVNPSLFLYNLIIISPNPSIEFLKIFINKKINTILELNIYDVNGRIVFVKNISSDYIISTNEWTKGIYFIHLKMGDHIFTKKIIKL